MATIAKIIQGEMFEKFANRYRKRILQCKCTNTLEETRHQPLFYVFRNGKRQSSNDSIVKYDEKRHVEIIYS